MIYLDHCASSPMRPEVAEHMYRILTTSCGNPNAIHCAGGTARSLIQESRRTLAHLLQVEEREVFFTSGGTESNNWAIKSGALANTGQHIVVSSTEHKSVLRSAEAIKARGFSVTYVHPDSNGIIHAEELESAIRPNTTLISIHASNNETGVLQDIAAIADLAHAHRICFHCDAVQSFGHVHQPFCKADLLSLSAHKLGGPVGVGCLVIRQPTRLVPLLDGGRQELGLRSGTENAAGISAFALAASLAIQQLTETQQHLAFLENRLLQGITQIYPQVVVHGGTANRLPGVMNLRFPGITGEELLMRLDLQGICISAGAACASHDPQPSHVLLAMGLSPQHAKESVRISLGYTTTPQDIDSTLLAISQILSKKHLC